MRTDLKSTIQKILREETEPPIYFRRRINIIDGGILPIDEILPHKVKNYYKPDTVCRFENGEELLEVVMYSVIETMYYSYFNNIDDNSEEWGIMFKFMETYIKDKYGDKLKEYYHINCGN